MICHMPGTTTAPPDIPEGRRASQRRALLADIESEARRLLVEGGAGNVSMRAIARGVGLGPASLYNYFDSLDDVFMMLLLTSYERLAEATTTAVSAFAKDPPADRAFVGVLAYRRWALTHPHEFNLIFTDQLPGFEAPAGGPTIAAQVAVFQPMIDALEEVTPPGTDLSPDELSIIVWSAFHGVVSLEVNHHLDWIGDTGAMHEKAVRRSLAGVGLPAPSPTVRTRFDRWAATH